MKRIIILVETQEQLLFFNTLTKGIIESGHHPVFITTKFSVLLRGKIQYRLDISIVKKSRKKFDSTGIENSVEVLSDLLNYSDALILWHAVSHHIEQLLQSDIYGVWVWGGNTVAAIAVKLTSARNKKPFLLFDRGNVEGKMFVDTKGVTIYSWLHEHNEYLHTIVTKYSHSSDPSNFKHYNFNVKKDINVFFLFDLIYWRISGIPFVGEKSFTNKLLKGTPTKPDYSKYDVTKKPFVYVALPHSFEVKKRHKNIAPCFEMLNKIIYENIVLSRDVVATIHPLEDDEGYINAVQALTATGKIIVTTTPAIELVKHCKKYYSFNTSVALHAIVNNIPIEFVEESLFKGWTNLIVKNYIDWYLIDLRIDESGFCSVGTINQLFERMNLK